MGRRRRRSSFSAREERSTMGDHALETACAKVEQMQEKAVNLMTSYGETAEHTVWNMFEPNTIDRARAAKGVVDTHTTALEYQVADKVGLTVQYADCSMLAIRQDRMVLQPNATKLLKFVAEVRAVHEQYEDVKAVLRWLNTNATAGAIRYYWPPALKLTQGNTSAFDTLQDVPVRFATPKDIGKWAQLLRETSTTLAGAAMMPSDAKAKHHDEMWLTFRSYNVQRGEVSYQADSRMYYI